MNTQKLDLLRESLPYIQRFKVKTFVVKFSGKVTEDRENLASLAEMNVTRYFPKFSPTKERERCLSNK